ncbi:MAG: BrnT family toxin [Deltaproteobacteria bacterium]|nr:BrnT family toxin [Deltaproteobacteria bacterium]
MKETFEWDARKDQFNQAKHGVSFGQAQYAFADPRRVIMRDVTHSAGEARYYCIGQASGGILTVRFTYRKGVIRIFGAGYWRRGKAIYEKENQIHQ